GMALNRGIRGKVHLFRGAETIHHAVIRANDEHAARHAGTARDRLADFITPNLFAGFRVHGVNHAVVAAEDHRVAGDDGRTVHPAARAEGPVLFPGAQVHAMQTLAAVPGVHLAVR